MRARPLALGLALAVAALATGCSSPPAKPTLSVEERKAAAERAATQGTADANRRTDKVMDSKPCATCGAMMSASDSECASCGKR